MQQLHRVPAELRSQSQQLIGVEARSAQPRERERRVGVLVVAVHAAFDSKELQTALSLHRRNG
jgi:hypothetical protein